jgi:deoxyribodipyrimidine photo-lyase
MNLPATRLEAHRRWQEFQPQLLSYGRRRNEVLPGHPYVSGLSPAVRARLITEQELVAAALAEAPFAQIEKFVQEVYWRSYWKCWLESRPSVWNDYRTRVHAAFPGGQRAQEIKRGHSGIAIMDHFTRELRTTGYLHNHARMWWASFWIHVERLPWEIGAEFFESHLLDADPASNTLSWRWVAGLQTKGKTYLVRRSNLEKYCAPDLLLAAGLDRLNDAVVRPALVPETADLTWVRPVLDNPSLEGIPEPYGLWLHEEDLCSENSCLAHMHPVALLAVHPEKRAQVNPEASELRERYREKALGDGLERAALHFHLKGELKVSDDLSTALVHWAQAHHLRAVIAMRPWVGPLADRLPGLHDAFAAAGLSLILVRRVEDLAQLPTAKAGYFSFWEKARASLTR